MIIIQETKNDKENIYCAVKEVFEREGFSDHDVFSIKLPHVPAILF
ncbi:TPA: hypothetical protein ACG3RW_003994 [Clostridioides difficile]|jgi:hypothetical protein